jgi:hypothetical protein
VGTGDRPRAYFRQRHGQRRAGLLKYMCAPCCGRGIGEVSGHGRWDDETWRAVLWCAVIHVQRVWGWAEPVGHKNRVRFLTTPPLQQCPSTQAPALPSQKFANHPLHLSSAPFFCPLSVMPMAHWRAYTRWFYTTAFIFVHRHHMPSLNILGSPSHRVHG